MAIWQLNTVALKGVSLCLPQQIVTNADFDFFTPEEALAFSKSVGINERRIAPPTVCASDLAEAAARKLLDELGWEPQSIDVLIFESVTADYRTPPTSCLLQERLGLSDHCFSLDVPMGCCGCLYALNLGANLLQNGTAKRALLLIGDTAQRMGSLQDKSRAPLFGDGAVAMALEYDEAKTQTLIAEFHTSGKGAEALMTPHGGYRHPATPESFIAQDFGNGIIRSPYDAYINGMDVLSFAISKPPRSAEDFFRTFEIDQDQDVDYYLIHQANKLIIDRIVKKLRLSTDRVPINLDRYGNLGGASIPSLMVTELREQLREGKHRLFLTAFGLGLTWGNIYLTTDNLILPAPLYY